MLKDRIAERLQALGINQFEAAERAGKNAHFIYDFMTGRKRSFKGDGPIRLAQALECSIEYLTGESDEIGEPPVESGSFAPAASSGLPVAGIIEAGVYRRIGATSAQDIALPIAPFPSYPADRQAAFIVRGGGMDALGIIERMVLVTVEAEAAPDLLRSGAIVIVEHVRGNGREVETSARELQYFPDRTELRAHSRTENIKPIILKDRKPVGETGKVKIIAIVLSATLIL